MSPMTLRELPAAERPVERFLAQGPDALSEAELLAIVIRTGTRSETAVDVARRVLSLDPEGLRYLVNARIEELAAVGGIGQVKAVQVKAALELGRRLTAGQGSRAAIRSPKDAEAVVAERLRYQEQEHFLVVLLNTKHHVLGVELVSVGGLSSSVVHPRDIFKGPIRRNAAAVILAHNHPSGDPAPSREDIDVTKRLCEAGRLLGIEVLDHIVVGDNRYVSFREKSLL
ncbi:MAG TPA: DNA repair protein RadC [Bacillota bacterium]|jgi:DNA repair protein RadC